MQFAELPLVATPISVVDENLVKEGIQRCSAELKLSDITLIRQSMNGVYQATAPDGPVIMRVSRPTGTTLPAIEFAHYLQNHGFAHKLLENISYQHAQCPNDFAQWLNQVSSLRIFLLNVRWAFLTF